MFTRVLNSRYGLRPVPCSTDLRASRSCEAGADGQLPQHGPSAQRTLLHAGHAARMGARSMQTLEERVCSGHMLWFSVTRRARVRSNSRRVLHLAARGPFRHARPMHARAASGSWGVLVCKGCLFVLSSCVGPYPQHAHRPKAVSFAMGCRVIRRGHNGGAEVRSLPGKRRRPRQRGGSKAAPSLTK